jgi:hypothetical protein
MIQIWEVHYLSNNMQSLIETLPSNWKTLKGIDLLILIYIYINISKLHEQPCYLLAAQTPNANTIKCFPCLHPNKPTQKLIYTSKQQPAP